MKCSFITYVEEKNKAKKAQLCGRDASYMVEGNSRCDMHIKRSRYLSGYEWLPSEAEVEEEKLITFFGSALNENT